MRSVVLLPAALLAALLSACAAGSPSRPSHPAPGGGVIAGTLVSQKSDGSSRAPMAGQVIGLFAQVVVPGKPVQHPPRAIATAVTAADGGFAFHGLRPGRYFVTAASADLGVPGQWARVDAHHGAWVLLIRCTDCAGPL